MKIIAFDSGLERTGWAVFEIRDNSYEPTSYDCIFTDKKDTLEKRLASLREQVEVLIEEHKPKVFAIEQLFFFANKTTVINVAQAQGTVITLAGEHSIDVRFLTPTQIKHSVTGYGNADKLAVQKMIKLQLHIDPLPKPDDTVDAIACGLTYCTMRKSEAYDWTNKRNTD